MMHRQLESVAKVVHVSVRPKLGGNAELVLLELYGSVLSCFSQ